MSDKLLSEAIQEYLTYRTRSSASGSNTPIGDRTALTMFLRHTKDRLVKNVTSEHVNAFFYGDGGLMDRHITFPAGGKKWQDPVCPGTHNNHRSRLRGFFRWCLDRGLVKSDPTSLLKPMPVKRKKRQQPGALSLLTILDAASNRRDRAFMACAMNTAMRASDITALTIGDVDLVDMWIACDIRKTHETDSKPISEDLGSELRVWLSFYEEHTMREHGRSLRDTDYLFPAAKNGALISHYAYDGTGKRIPVQMREVYLPERRISRAYPIVQRALKKLGMPTHQEGVHTLRRAVARAYFDMIAGEKGDSAALRETAAFLNHTNTANTEIYLGITAEKARRDRRLRNQPFLTALAAKEAPAEVIQLRAIGSSN